MNMNKKLLLGIAVVLALALLYSWMSYNRLVSASVAIDGQWAQVETQYQRRFDLIPNLVSTVKGVAQQEQTVFGAIADARTRYAGAVTVEDKVKAANDMETGLARLLVIAENYPQLTSSASFQNLMVQLEGTENRISAERGRYNDRVREYNLITMRFPSNIAAAIFGFAEKSYFQAEQGASGVPAVSF